jgi:hypothetical protein
LQIVSVFVVAMCAITLAQDAPSGGAGTDVKPTDKPAPPANVEGGKTADAAKEKKPEKKEGATKAKKAKKPKKAKKAAKKGLKKRGKKSTTTAAPSS